MSTPLTSTELAELAQIAERASDAARGEILSRFRNTRVSTKADGTVVTEADLAAEKAMRAIFEKETPQVGVLGEEYGGEVTSGLTWIVDPIDGTISYSRGIPLFGSLIALLQDGEPVLGLIDLPALDERTLGWQGGGVRRNGESIRCSSESNLEEAIIAHGDAYTFQLAGQEAAFAQMTEKIPLLRGYTDALGHALTLSGSVGAMVDLDLNLWDFAATQALIPEAGGRCEIIDCPNDKKGLIIGSPELVTQLMSFLEP
jgi:histidinol-phosphatase